MVARYIQEHGLYRDLADSAASPGDAEGGSTLTPEIAACVAAARDKKAEDPVVLDLRNSDFTDYLFICHGTNDRQVRAIADSIEERLRKELGVKPSHIEGHRESSWILMDYIDFVVHVFDHEKRDYYRLERLWGDAPRLELPEEDETARRPGAATS
jgi:ribosome-associated protein